MGLALLSLGLASVLLWLVRQLSQNRRIGPRLVIALALFWLFVWLSPQLYYAYYLLIFDGLPLQSVIGGPPSPVYIARLLGFSAASDLSHLGQGVLGWLCVACALWPQRQAPGL